MTRVVRTRGRRRPSSLWHSTWAMPPGDLSGPPRSGVIDVELVPAAQARDSDLVSAVAEIVNGAYLTAEQGLWRQDTPRTHADEITAVIAKRELAVARLDGRVAGALFV